MIDRLEWDPHWMEFSCDPKVYQKLSENNTHALQLLHEVKEHIISYCPECDGKGYIKEVKMVHICGGDERVCARKCPEQSLELNQCELCGPIVNKIINFISESEVNNAAGSM